MRTKFHRLTVWMVMYPDVFYPPYCQDPDAKEEYESLTEEEINYIHTQMKGDTKNEVCS